MELAECCEELNDYSKAAKFYEEAYEQADVQEYKHEEKANLCFRIASCYYLLEEIEDAGYWAW